MEEALVEMYLPEVCAQTERGHRVSRGGGAGEEMLYYYTFPRDHWRCLRTNNPLERLLCEVRRRTREGGAFRTTELNSSKAFRGTNDSCDYFRVLTSSAVERPKVSDSSRMARCGRFHASATIYRGRALPSS